MRAERPSQRRGTRYSLAARLLLASLLVVPLFLAGTGWYLERSYRVSLESAVEDRLHSQVLTLMAEADYDDSLLMPEAQLEARFNQVNSGLFGLISDAGGNVLWRSRSSIASDADLLATGQLQTRAGQQGFLKSDALYQAWYSVLWQTESGMDVPLVFSVLETNSATMAQLASLRASLALWLGATTLVLLGLQAAVLFWGLRPLRDLAADISAIESGEASQLRTDYPREVLPVTDSLNSLLRSEAKRRDRARNTMADLAHSLKTPLAVLRNTQPDQPDYVDQVRTQSNQMEEIIQYQLQRASGAGHSLLRLVEVQPVVQRLADTLAKVYAEKSLKIDLQVSSTSRFRGDERDLMELLGNLMENGCKYGRERVCVRASGSGEALELTVEDDGPGMEPALRERLLARGARADQTQPGQGIGLAVAADIVQSYGGQLTVDDSPLGGCHITVSFGGASPR